MTLQDDCYSLLDVNNETGFLDTETDISHNYSMREWRHSQLQRAPKARHNADASKPLVTKRKTNQVFHVTSCHKIIIVFKGSGQFAQICMYYLLNQLHATCTIRLLGQVQVSQVQRLSRRYILPSAAHCPPMSEKCTTNWMKSTSNWRFYDKISICIR